MTKEPISATVRAAAGELLMALRRIEASLPTATAEGVTAADSAYGDIKSAIDACIDRLRSLHLEGPANQLPSSELWNLAGEMLQRGWLQTQARTKPRGYAGDHEMLSRIYENRLCDDPLGRQFDRYFQEEAAPRAVRNRMRMMRDWIVAASERFDRPWKVSVVGSAFGLEVRDALQELSCAARKKIRVTLLDLDPAALDFAKRHLAPWLEPEQLEAVSGNLFRLPSRPALARPLAQSDLLYCPGLFDYLTDEEAAAMLGVFRRALSPDGVARVFQFAPHNPTRVYMEWLGNWYLTYRATDELRRLALAAGITDDKLSFGNEPLGVDLLLSVMAD